MKVSDLFRRWSVVALLITVGHLLFGNIVSGTDSGMGCGPEWPLCRGQLLPPLSDPALVIEWVHRLLALLVGGSIVGLALIAWRRERDKPLLVWLTMGSLVLVVVVAILGGMTVLLDLPVALSTAHFGLGTLLFMLLVMLAAKAHTLASSPSQGDTHRWALLAVILLYIQALLGAYVRHSQAGMALPLWPFLTFFPNLAVGPLASHWSHRALAVIIAGVVAFTSVRAGKSGYTVLGVSSSALVLVQIALGMLTVATRLDPFVAMLHLAGALALLGTQLVLVVRTWPMSAYAPLKGEAQAL